MNHSNHEEVARILGAIRAIDSLCGARPQMTLPVLAQSMIRGWPAALDAASMNHMPGRRHIPRSLS